MRVRPSRIFCYAIAMISFVIVFAGCAQQRLNLKEDNPQAVTALATLRAVTVSGDTSRVEISADSPLVYTSYKLTNPPKAVIDLAQTEPGSVSSPIGVGKGSIKQISVTRHAYGESVLTRIEIALSGDEDFSVDKDTGDKTRLAVIITRPNEQKEAKKSEADTKPAAPELKTAQANTGEVSQKDIASLPPVVKPAAPPHPAEAGGVLQQKGKVLTAIVTSQDSVELNVPGGVTSFNSFKLDKPFRLIVDIPGVKSGVGASTIAIDKFGVGKARVGVSPDKVRVVFDITNGAIPPYQIFRSDAGLRILFKGAASAAPAPAVGEKAIESAEQPVKQKPVARPVAPLRSTVESIEFKPLEANSRILIRVTGDCKADKPRKVAAGWTVSIRNCQLPRRLQRKLDTTAFPSPVREITPFQVRVRGGYETKLLVKLASEVPFDFKQEGDAISWDFQNAETAAKPAPLPEAPKQAVLPAPAAPAKAKVVEISDRDSEKSADGKKVYTGRRVTLEFSDADIKKILQLIAEVSNINFLTSDDVTGTISLKLVNVPWDQALDVILDTKNLEKRQEGNILYIKPRGKFKTAEQEEAEAKREREKRMELKTRIFQVSFGAIADVAAQFDKLKTDRGAISLDTRTNRVIVTDIEDRLDKMAGLLKELDTPEMQVMIEARIVEATSTFTRDLGVQWGLHYQDGSASFLGINNLDAGFGGVANAPPSSGTFGPGGAVGMSFGKLTSNIQLDLRLSAAAAAGLVKIISTPKVVTLNNKAAKISQGQSIPYQTSSANTGPVTAFVEAALTLEVTPHITAEGSIGMKIKASNNSPGAVPQGATVPSINKKEATTELQVTNGETTVIGGIYVDNESESNTGVPFLMDIPLLGWLFKSNNKTKAKTELLIFITPRIVS